MIDLLLWLLSAATLYLVVRVLGDAAPLLRRLRRQRRRPWRIGRKAGDA